MLFLIRLILCVAIVGVALYAYVEENNRLTELRIKVPLLTKKLKDLQEENTRLQFEIEKFENPLNLMELARKPQYGHLKHPYTSDIIRIPAQTSSPIASSSPP
jgi:hypothetical protein